MTKGYLCEGYVIVKLALFFNYSYSYPSIFSEYILLYNVMHPLLLVASIPMFLG